jgi:streptogramin lyase
MGRLVRCDFVSRTSGPILDHPPTFWAWEYRWQSTLTGAFCVLLVAFSGCGGKSGDNQTTGAGGTASAGSLGTDASAGSGMGGSAPGGHTGGTGGTNSGVGGMSVATCATAYAEANVSFVALPSNGPTQFAFPSGLVTGPDNNIWLSQSIIPADVGNSIGHLTPSSGAFTEYPVTDTNGRSASASSIIVGPDQNLWFAYGNGIGSISTSGNVKQYPFPSSLTASAKDIVFGPDGNVYFTGSEVVGEVTLPGGTVETFMDTAGDTLFALGIAVGSDKNIWFMTGDGLAESITHPGVGRLTVADDSIDWWSLPNTGLNVITGPDGNLWFGSPGITPGPTTPTITGPVMSRITPGDNPAPSLMSFVISPNDPISQQVVIATPKGLTPGPDGNVWFALSNATTFGIGRITPSGDITPFVWPATVGKSNCHAPQNITFGPDGAVWFTIVPESTQTTGAFIGRLSVSG